MTDRYEKIRRALAMGPTPGPWIVTHELRECDETVCDLVNGTWIVTAPGVKLAPWEYDAAHIAACDPDTIRALLEERDALAAALEAARADAERYRHIRRKESSGGSADLCIFRVRWAKSGVKTPEPDYDLLVECEADAAIDQARGEESGNG